MRPTELPSGLYLKHPVPSDAEAIAAMMCLVDLAEIGEAETDANDVRDDWALPRFDLSRDAWIVVGDGESMHGYGWVWDKVPDHEMIGDIYVLPGEAHATIAAVLCARIEERATEHLSAAPSGDEVSLGFFASVGTPWARFLDERGYPVARTYFRMQIELGEEAPVPADPAGIDVRTFQPGTEDAALHLAMQESFAEHYLFSAESLGDWMRRRSGHAAADPTLWRIAWDGSEPAGGILAYPFEGMAWIREVGVRRPWRSRGVGRALLLHAFAALHARGHRRIGLGVDAENATGATRLYESVGMNVTLRHEFHRRVLRPGRSVSAQG